jgi:hypothetical protein
MINSVNCVLAFLQNAKLFKHHWEQRTKSQA